MQYIFIVFCLLFIFVSSTSSAAQSPKAAAALSPLQSSDQGLLFTIKGSNTIGAKLAPYWAKHYLEAKGLESVTIIPGAAENELRVAGVNGGIRAYIDIYAHGSSTGFAGLKDKTADIAMSSRPIKANENRNISVASDLQDFEAEHVVAIDGLAIIVHPQNPINVLSLQQVAQIFSGKISYYPQSG